VIDLLLLGTGAMMPSPDRWLSSLLMRVGGQLAVFDCGEGTQIPWQSIGWGFRKLSTICLSHMHADHVAGLPGLLHAIANANRTEPVAIFGPPGTMDVVNALRAIAPVLPYELRIRELDGHDAFAMAKGATGVAFESDHRLPCISYRIQVKRRRRFLADRARELQVPTELWNQLQHGGDVSIDGRLVESASVLGPPRQGLSIGFVTDTRPVEGLAEFLQGVDLLICEGTYGDNADQPKAVERKHMTFAEAAGLAKAAGVGALWLTHFSPAIADPMEYRENATRVFPNTTIGFSGLTATLSFADDDQEPALEPASGSDSSDC
jgi:ribonuclease Z